MNDHDRDGKLGRRGALSMGLGALLSLRWLREGVAFGAPPEEPARGRTEIAPAKSCIVLWMNGGPSQLDTFDPKPGTEVGGPFKAIATRASGVKISEHLPHLADQAHHLAVVRGMTSKEGSHPRAQELGRTGHTPNPTAATPSLGSWVAKYKAPKSLDLPGFVALGGPSVGGGILGHEYDPLTIQSPGARPQNLDPFQELSDERLASRRAALAALDADFASRMGDKQVRSRDAVIERAVRVMKSTQTQAFDVSSEPEAVKKAYGDSAFGRGCLTARRLVEIGVPFVEVTLDGWDTHQNNFDRTKGLMGALDPAMATLLKELDERKLLDSTIVVWMGEFGRTPNINSNDGRDHFPGAWSAAVAGGGFRGGIAHGATDADGKKVVENPTTVPDLLATISSRLGLDPATAEVSPRGGPISVTEGGQVVRGLLRAG